MQRLFTMLRTFDEIFDFLDSDGKIYPWFEREANSLTKILDGFFEYTKALKTNDFDMPMLNITDPNPVWMRAVGENYCGICLLEMGKEKGLEAKGKKGHPKCLNFYLNRMIKED